MEEARTIRGPGGLVARIRLPQRGEARSFEKGAAPAKRREEPEEEVASRVETLKVFALGGVALLMVPVFFLSMADPLAPPSPELAADGHETNRLRGVMPRQASRPPLLRGRRLSRLAISQGLAPAPHASPLMVCGSAGSPCRSPRRRHDNPRRCPARAWFFVKMLRGGCVRAGRLV